jgi:putative ABC transport system substrate-binding protein
MTSRRAFLSAALALASGPLAAQGGPQRTYRIGLLDPSSPQSSALNMAHFRKGLSELGYDRRNLDFEYLSADGRQERLPQLAKSLIARNVDLIFTSGTPATLAAKAASAGRVPVVTAAVIDPVETHVIDSMAAPGFVTGAAIDTADLEARRLELLHALAPSAKHLGAVIDTSNPGLLAAWKAVREAARGAGFEAELIELRKAEEAPRILAAAATRGVDAVTVRLGGLAPAARQGLVESATRCRMPAIYASRRFVEVGGLASYGVNAPQMYYRAAAFVDKILRGTSPDKLPMERASQFELVLNRRAAHSLNLVIPPDLLLKSDEVLG